MNAERRTRLEEAGIDVGEALERMLGSEALLERLLGKFRPTPTSPPSARPWPRATHSAPWPPRTPSRACAPISP